MFRSQLTARLLTAFEKAGISLPEGTRPTVVLAADTRYGDYQSNTCMGLAKQLKTNPRALAQQVADALDVSDLCAKVSIDGPGFLNFTLGDAALSAHVLTARRTDQLGVPTATPRTIVVDFSAPNIAKPMHVGHIRSTIIGDCLARVARFLGHHVITDNHIGDWGTQFGMILHGWKTLLDEAALEKDPIAELLRLYKTVNAAAKADEAVMTTCREELVQLQQGDAENLAIWRRCVDLSLDQLRVIYAKLGVRFDHYLGESSYNDALAPLVENLLASHIAEISEGAVCIFFRDDPTLADKPCLIRKSDGGFLYATTDLATIDHRINVWHATDIWYVVGSPQELHFKQIFAASHKRGQTASFQHVAFGSILGPDGKMFRTRSGESVGLIEVLDEAIERAAAVVAEREGLSDEEKATIGETIGIGAVKYAELSQNRLTDYKFSWDKMLSLQGNTAPYLINAYVRTRAIFRKLEGTPEGAGEIEAPAQLVFTEPAERALAMKLAQYAEAVHDVLDDFRPNLLANYLYELATTYHAFYEACPVLSSQGDIRATRLILCDLTSQVLKSGLGLLGIQTTERM
ncbi:MAG: arginine--tRNA ligase [Verrucomicrobiales bacterium]|nr:arginine--tRNA ligase [Verrucomicrobiales bacterium]